MNEEIAHKIVDKMLKTNAELRSRCDALEVGIGVLALKLGVNPDEIQKIIDDERNRIYLERQIKIEDGLGPDEASDIFRRDL
jgi:hypothetical protein